MKPSQKVRLAYHEAGHVVMALVHEIKIETATIIPGEGYSGRVVDEGLRISAEQIEQDVDLERRLELEKQIMTFMAGQGAECILVARKNRAAYWHGRSFGDMEQIRILLGHLSHEPREGGHYFGLLWHWSIGTLKQPFNWMTVDFVAKELLKKKTLPGEEIENVRCTVASISPKEWWAWEEDWKENLSI